MSNWALILVAIAGGSALLVWHAASHTKHASEEMLKKYREMLAEARARKMQPKPPDGSATGAPGDASATGEATAMAGPPPSGGSVS